MRPHHITRTSTRRATARGSLAIAGVLLLLAGCKVPGQPASNQQPSSAPTTQSAATYAEHADASSEFTRDGTYQSHQGIDGLDFVLTAYPSKQTPRTHEWYPKGKKYFNFTFQAYDLDVGLRAPFAQKRKVWLDTVQVTSSLKPHTTARAPYRLSAEAKKVTFDPEPLADEHGMLITSPKGSLEMRDQIIGTVPAATTTVTLKFRFVVWIEGGAGSTGYHREVIRQTMPISIFPSNKRTQVARVPIDAS